MTNWNDAQSFHPWPVNSSRSIGKRPKRLVQDFCVVVTLSISFIHRFRCHILIWQRVESPSCPLRAPTPPALLLQQQVDLTTEAAEKFKRIPRRVSDGLDCRCRVDCKITLKYIEGPHCGQVWRSPAVKTPQISMVYGRFPHSLARACPKPESLIGF